MQLVGRLAPAILANAKDFEVGFGMLPYYDDVDGRAAELDHRRRHAVGAAAARTHADYKGVAKFFTYLSQPEVQADWHQCTGYLPITKAAYELGKKQGYYENNPGSDIVDQADHPQHADRELQGPPLRQLVQIRDVIDEEFESALAGQKTAQEALDAAVSRGNELLREFEQANC